MKQFKVLSLVALVLVLALGIVIATLTPTPILAQDGGDGLNLPTPTPYPVDDLSYDLQVVGGEDVTLTFDGLEQDGFVIGETSVRSQYPRGMVFSVPLSYANGDITSVVLYIRYVNSSNTRVQATFDDENQVWMAHPWEAGEGQPAWTPFDFFWRVSADDGTTIDSTSASTDYWDPAREWYRVESAHIILYWFGIEEVDPDYIAENVTYAMNATEPRRVEGFGGPISYKPVGVVYPDDETEAEIYGSGVSNDNSAGFTSSDLGMTVQGIGMPSDAWFERQKDCIYLRPREERTEQVRVDQMIFTVVPHEVAHLYQYDKGVALGPNWWIEGQADYFTLKAGDYDARIRHLATLQDIPTLEGNIGAFTYEADGCYALAYDLGVSFINWLLTNYGGLETHAKLEDRIASNAILKDAIEEVTGKSFFDLQNEWRAYLGYAPFTLADVDPASAMADPIDPIYQVGDSFTVPGPRPLSVYPNPGPKQISNAACFANLSAEVTRSGNLDGVNYYEINCSGIVGWAEESQLPRP